MQLNFKKFGEGFPVIILHGLFGSLDNWQTIAKKISEKFQVFIIDERNHGKSPHSDEFGYKTLSDDLFEFIENQNIRNLYLIGHSMGGKAAMQFVFEHQEKVEKLIIVDVAPVQYEDRHSDVFNALFAADAGHRNSREEVQSILRNKLNNDETTVQFLMKSLQRAPQGEQGFQWKFNLESLHKNYAAISGAVTSTVPFMGQTLFIKGEKSSYINPDNYAVINKLFPDNQLTEIKGAGHWIHAEKQAEFIQEVMRFLS